MTSATSLSRLPSFIRAKRRWLSPLGPMLLARTDLGLAGLWFDGQKDHPGELDAPEMQDDGMLLQTVGELDLFFRGKATGFSQPLDLHGTAFQRAVWLALLQIDIGQTSSYGDVARAVGSPGAMRAVGAAVGKNPISVIVPCHRVIGSNGELTGYAGGLDRKRALLQIERQSTSTSAGAR